MKVLGISTSPRRNGNSETLLRRALAGAEAAGAEVDFIRLSDLTVGPCIECNSCYTTGVCALEDDYVEVLRRMLDADRLIFAMPVFFMSACAQAKMLIDRGQCLWAAKYILKKSPVGEGEDRRAMVIAVGGSKSKKQFNCIRLMMKVYLDSLGVRYESNLFVNQVDETGDIEKHTAAMDQAFKLGSALALRQCIERDKPVDVELF
ncbi:MAG TPA: flavodoxin family protein [Sedimentisphaerales bacterium]|nr:flavodoxin family protein [Sedimentisphaerales bacterium]